MTLGKILAKTKKPLTGLNGKWFIFRVETAGELSNHLEEDIKLLNEIFHSLRWNNTSK